MLNYRFDAVVKESAFGKVDSLLDRIRKAIRLADYSEAEILLGEVQECRDRHAAEYFNLLGALYEGKKKWRLARKYYLKANAILNDYEPARFNLQKDRVGAAQLGDEMQSVWFAKLP